MSQRFVTFASVISEIQQSDLFMTVKARILETPKANLNGARVTPAFVDEIIANEDRYIGLPLYADVKALKRGNYNRLGHLYDSKTGEFHSTQIGSFYQFEKEEIGENEGAYLVGYARIPKRDKDLSKAIAELFADGSLKFSFEISCGEYTELDDGTFEIDASENNFLEGTAIVTFPACEEAVALEFVAQREADDTERGETEMAEVETKAEVVETEATAEAVKANAEAVETEVTETEDAACNKDKEKAEETACEDKKETVEAETAEAEVSEENKETAAVIVHECHEVTESVYAYDTESGVDVSQRVSVETCVSHVEPDAQIVEADDGIHIAETEAAEASGEGGEGGEGGETPAQPETPAGETPAAVTEEPEQTETPASQTTDDTGVGGTNQPVVQETVPADTAVEDVVPVDDQNEKKKTAEALIAELAEAVRNLTAEVQILKEESKKHVAASRDVIAEQANPFVDNMSANGNKYGLLEKDSVVGSYSLLSK